MSTIKPIDDLFSSIEGTIQETNALFQQISAYLEDLKGKMLPEQKNQHQADDSVGSREQKKEGSRNNKSENPTLRFSLQSVRNILLSSLTGLARDLFYPLKSLEMEENPPPKKKSPSTKNSVPNEQPKLVPSKTTETKDPKKDLINRLEEVLSSTESEITSSPFNLHDCCSIILQQENQKDLLILGHFFSSKGEHKDGTKTENQEAGRIELSGRVCIKTESTLYFGEMKEGKKHGIGAQTFDDGVIFRGKWFEGQPERGLWRLPDGNELFGQRTLVKVRSDPADKVKRRYLPYGTELFGQRTLVFVNGQPYRIHEVMIGLKSERDDPLEDSSCFQRVNYLFWNGRKTQLSNLKNPQKLCIGDTDSDADPLTDPQDISIFKSSVEFLNGVIYEGSFKDFNPVNCGVLKIPERLFTEADLDFNEFFGKKSEDDFPGKNPQEKYVEYRVISSVDKVLFYTRFIEVSHHIIFKGRILHYVKIEFLNGNCYQGMVNDKFDFFGLGAFWNKKRPLSEKKYVLVPLGGNSLLEFEPKSKFNKRIVNVFKSSPEKKMKDLLCLNEYFFDSRKEKNKEKNKDSLPHAIKPPFEFKGSTKQQNNQTWK